ncbi:MAG: hypothetical protein U0837_15285 [Dehalococcoidia bacterium]
MARWAKQLFVDAVPSITSLKALPGDGRELTFTTYAPPTQSGITRRFAWITIGKIGSSFTLIGYDVAENVSRGLGTAYPARRHRPRRSLRHFAVTRGVPA